MLLRRRRHRRRRAALLALLGVAIMSRLLTALLLDELRGDPAALAELRDLIGPADVPERAPAAFTARTLARELGVTPRAIRAAISRGDLPARKSGRTWVISPAAVDAWARPRGSRRRRTSPARDRSRAARDAIRGVVATTDDTDTIRG